jgi:radical SAM superfamily enzyme YgiQ (UPF0313 family)
MKVLLINPNRYKFPPVPPIGLEQIAGALAEGGHEVAIADLCFSDSIYEDIDRSVSRFAPDIAGVTVRNIDTVLYQTNEFFLDEIKAMIGYVKSQHGLKVIIGGSGVPTNPEGVREYLNADYAITGAGEDAVVALLDMIENSGDVQKIFRGKSRFDISCPRRRTGIDYRRYFDLGGVAGFETHRGCSSSCVYCIEANSKVSFKGVSDIIAELRSIVDSGYRRFHLCDSEFNEDLDYAVEFCTALKKSGLNIDWSVYMKPANYNKKLFRMMKETGVSLITLTVDSWKKCPLYWADIEKMIFHGRSAGIKTAVDFLTGFPYEGEETLKHYLDLFRRTGPDSVGINTYIRLYKQLQITNLILKDAHLWPNVTGEVSDRSFVKPVFYNQVSAERLKEMIKNDKMFRIEGLEKGVNYLRTR